MCVCVWVCTRQQTSSMQYVCTAHNSTIQKCWMWGYDFFKIIVFINDGNRGVWYDDFWSLTVKMSLRSAFGEVSCYSEHYNYTSCINILYNATYIHISVNTAVELLSQDTALIYNHKSTLFECFKTLPVKHLIRVLFWRALSLSPYTWRARMKKPVKQHLITELSYLLR